MNEVTDLLKVVLDCAEPIIKTYQEIFLDYVAIDPLIASHDELLDLIKHKNKLSEWLLKEQDSDILLQFIFSEIIEPEIGNSSPCFIYNFPRSQASLAKLCPRDNRVAQRFECYYQGVELVNGFNELTSFNSQIARFQEDNMKRKILGVDIKPMDDYFLSALSSGLPQCSGVALGVDRLIMLALKVSSIEKVLTFPVYNA
jgi:lysyl-tRNA synthetase class 2